MQILVIQIRMFRPQTSLSAIQLLFSVQLYTCYHGNHNCGHPWPIIGISLSKPHTVCWTAADYTVHIDILHNQIQQWLINISLYRNSDCVTLLCARPWQNG